MTLFFAIYDALCEEGTTPVYKALDETINENKILLKLIKILSILKLFYPYTIEENK